VLPNFRADNAYVWQSRERNGPARYALTAFYVKDHDPLSLLGRLGEDGLFGAYTVEVDGVRVSRDLLDSILELSFLEEELGLSHLGEITLLDIGAGYGRLAHRATEALPNVTCICADAIPISTYLSEYYLRFRGVRRAEVAPLDRVGAALEKRHVDIAVSVHSFSEAPLESIAWWLDLIAENGVSYLMIVPTKGTQLVSTERSGAREYLPLLTSRGFELVACRPKYAHSPAAQEWGVFPTHHLLFRRR
jgi:hypothetical protein